MDSSKEETSSFNLFDAAGVGLISFEREGRIVQHNEMAPTYLGLDSASLLGKDVAVLETVVSSREFFESIKGSNSFYCLVPGANRLLVMLYTPAGNGKEGSGDSMIMLRPYGLEREFVRMRSELSRNVVLEINSRLNSISIASEIIMEPDIREGAATRERFLSTFSRDVTDLSELFYGLQEIADPIPFPNRVHSNPLDWKTLLADLVSKMRGLGNERNVSISSDLPAALGSPQGDYHWLYLAVFTLLSHAVRTASPLSEVSIRCRSENGSLETTLEYQGNGAGDESENWPPRTLFPLTEGESGAGTLSLLTNLALAKSILRLHRGELGRVGDGETSRFQIRLPL